MTTEQFDPKTFLERVGDGKTITRHETGTVIFKQGTAVNAVGYLQWGKAKESVKSDQGKDAVVGILESGRFFGTSILNGNARWSTITAITPCLVTAISIEALREALKYPSFSQMFMTYLLRRIATMKMEKLDLLVTYSRAQRLAQTLLTLSRFGESPRPEIIGPEITQELLAEMIGTTRPRVNKHLNRFRYLGWITYNEHGITVLPELQKALLHNSIKDEPES
jgi:CRP-like cAMP-binding protein